MQLRGLPLSVSFALILSIGFNGSRALAAGAPDFSITATNATVSATGTGTTTFTLTSLKGYTGTVVVTCYASSPPAGAKLPYCGGGAIRAEKLTAGEIVSGSLPLTEFPVPVAASLPRRPGAGPASSVAVAGALLLGLGLRRRARRWLVLGVFAAGALAGFAGISACAANGNGLTQGTFPYTVVATDTTTNAMVSSTFMVTVP